MFANRFLLPFKKAAISIKYAVVFGWVGVIFALTLPSASQASPMVAPGWDLFETLPGTTFMGEAFEGVNLRTFDFGGAIGVRNTGTADTIVQRLDTANAPSETIPIEMVALQLVSVNPVDFGFGLDFHFITLQSVQGGPASTGTMTIDFFPEPPSLTDPHGTFDSLINVAFDVRIGALDGPIAFSDMLPLVTPDPVPWAHQSPDPNVLEIPGVNTLLNGVDRTADFFPLGVLGDGVFEEREERNGRVVAIHVVRAAVPEPATLALFSVGLGLLGLGRKRKA